MHESCEMQTICNVRIRGGLHCYMTASVNYAPATLLSMHKPCMLVTARYSIAYRQQDGLRSKHTTRIPITYTTCMQHLSSRYNTSRTYNSHTTVRASAAQCADLKLLNRYMPTSHPQACAHGSLDRKTRQRYGRIQV